ncbi:hypothetical protein ACIBQX_23050 [Nonomuraea sp. NPDC049714]
MVTWKVASSPGSRVTSMASTEAAGVQAVGEQGQPASPPRR